MAGRDVATEPRLVTLGEFALAIEGLALLRGLFDVDESAQQERIAEIRRIVAEYDEQPWSLGLRIPERDALSGYATWSETYDTARNGLIDLEQPAMDEILARMPAGTALDAACGTGRHTKTLAATHRTTGIDQSPEMLAIARTVVPDATFEEGDFNALRFDDASFDLVVCSLALTHSTDVTGPIREFARVVKAGGRVVLSDIHPSSVLTLGQGFYSEGDGRFAFVRNHVHMISTYLEAFRACGLAVVDCHELRTPPDPRYGGAVQGILPDAAVQATVGLPFVLIWELSKPA